MINFELLYIFIFRTFSGVFLTVVLGFVGWLMIHPSFKQAMLDSELSGLMPVLVIGISAGVGASAAWWNTEIPRTLRWVYTAVILATALLSTWMAFQYGRGPRNFVFVTGKGMVPVIYLKEVLFATIFAAAIGGNLVGGVFYLYRAIMHREI